MIAKIGRRLPDALAFLVLLGISSTALGQGNTFNPYGNSGYADYREFGNPMVSNNPALPGQAVLNGSPTIGRPRANTFQQYANELDAENADPVLSRRATSNLPYFQSYQRLNSGTRSYQPNNTSADRKFYERQRQRDLDYAKALEERDPVKRSKLLRQVELNSLDRPATPRTGATKATTAPKPTTGAARTSPSARVAAPAERRIPAPDPFDTPSSTPRRPATTRPPAASGRPATTEAPKPGPAATSRTADDASSIPIPPPR